MSRVNAVLAILWAAALFHAAAHEDVNTTVVFTLLACGVNIAVEVIIELAGHEKHAELLWRIVQVAINVGMMTAATRALGDTASCLLF